MRTVKSPNLTRFVVDESAEMHAIRLRQCVRGRRHPRPVRLAVGTRGADRRRFTSRPARWWTMAVPLQNRVAPTGEIVADPARGLLTGNRGCLHDANKQLTGRRWTTNAWITCTTTWPGVRRELMRPGFYTELFFLDEPTARRARFPLKLRSQPADESAR